MKQMKLNARAFFNIFLCVSLVGLFIYVLGLDEIRYLKLKNIYYLLLSGVFLLLGFVFQAYSWQLLVAAYISNLKPIHAFQSVALSIFGKYLPGKVWMIVGRAGYLAAIYSQSLTVLNLLSVLVQVMAILSGLVLGVNGLLVYAHQNDNHSTNVVLVLLAIIMAFGICYYVFSRYFVPRGVNISIKAVFRSLVVSSASWLCWGIGFAFLIASFSDAFRVNNISVFAAAAVSGIVAFFSPGGLGVREGVMSFLLYLEIKNLDLCLAYATIARIWFLLGEVMFFMVGLLSKRFVIGSRDE